jgi:hypothetical protein
MTHTPEWEHEHDGGNEIFRLVEGQVIRGRIIAHENDVKRIVTKLNALDGVTLGEGASVKLLAQRMGEAIKAIESLDADALGHVESTASEQGWFIRDELLNYCVNALAPFVESE